MKFDFKSQKRKNKRDYTAKEEKDFWKKIFQKPSGDKKNFDSAKKLIIKYNCLEDTLTRAKHFAEVAIDSLSIFPDNQYKKSLIKLIETSLKRIN